MLDRDTFKAKAWVEFPDHTVFSAEVMSESSSDAHARCWVELSKQITRAGRVGTWRKQSFIVIRLRPEEIQHD
jgi:hypothetical protein